MSALVELSEVHRITIDGYLQLAAGALVDEDTRVELIEDLFATALGERG